MQNGKATIIQAENMDVVIFSGKMIDSNKIELRDWGRPHLVIQSSEPYEVEVIDLREKKNEC